MIWKLILAVVFITVVVKWIRRDSRSNPVNQAQKNMNDFFMKRIKK